MTPPALPGHRLLTLCSLALVVGCAAGCTTWQDWKGRSWAWWHQNAGMNVPETLPLGSTVRAHYHTMQTNGEAADFILHRLDFVGSTAELTPAGRDRILEIAARARSAPFPVLIERSWNNANPELDQHRRRIVAAILTDLGIPEADQRVIVAPAYGKGITSQEGQMDYYQFIYSRGYGGYGYGGYGNAGGFGAGGLGGFGGVGGFGGFGGGLGFF